jgi:hypothetical protein
MLAASLSAAREGARLDSDGGAHVTFSQCFTGVHLGHR